MTRPSRNARIRKFTGWHMTAILVGFFGVVIAVNFFMAHLATSTFGGVVVENSYVASQEFNGWLAEAKAEEALGWKATIARGPMGEVVVVMQDGARRPLAGASVKVVAQHPLGQRPEQNLTFRERSPGDYTARLEPGRWRLKVEVRAHGRTWRTVGDVQ